MKITIDRNEGMFEPQVCDLINIKSQRVDDLIGKLKVPDIAVKENISRLTVTFQPIDTTVSYSVSGGTVNSNIKINRMINSSIKVGKVYLINLVFPDVKCKSYPSGHPSDYKRFFRTDSFIKIATINVNPDQDIYFRAVPLNPSKEENPLAEDNQLGDAMIVKVAGGTFDVLVKGLVLDGADIPVYSFFIKNE